MEENNRQIPRSRLYHGYMAFMLTLLVIIMAAILSFFAYGAMQIKNLSTDVNSKFNSLNSKMTDLNNNLQSIKQLNDSINQLNKKL